MFYIFYLLSFSAPKNVDLTYEVSIVIICMSGKLIISTFFTFYVEL